MRTTEFIEAKIQQRPVLLISKEHVTSCCEIEGILEGYNLNAKRPDMYEVLNIESRQDCSVIETYLWHKLIYKNRQVPHLFVDGKHIGGEAEIKRLHESGELKTILENAGQCEVPLQKPEFTDA
ncbi:Glutaredoxin 3 [Fasciolopsis buskii]|uniref:Glutaredoxin 3 n=1 Tax=Fasciolopsis buskii TaxID=27845 RepID=A0A8E0RLN6_9TREM|nr:Glutaredoxin 3 [Fasciolopsis buski]